VIAALFDYVRAGAHAQANDSVIAWPSKPPREFDAYIRREISSNAALVKPAGITVN